jgi:16S rRNA (cytidine1402-2'-O)-methyltransferase
MSGRIFLIPLTLGGDDIGQVIPEKVLIQILKLRYFAVENIRTARRFLRLVDKKFPIDDTVFFELNEHSNENDITSFLSPVLDGTDLGIMSEAGLPAIADPGSLIVALAHKKNIRVIPLSGPSSIILALISSGMNGQNFTFNGYLPVKPSSRSARLRELERLSFKGQAQIFMETPYRNQKMLETIISVCDPGTKLCIASEITMPEEFIRTKTIAEWRKDPPSLTDKRVIYIIQQ